MYEYEVLTEGSKVKSSRAPTMSGFSRAPLPDNEKSGLRRLMSALDAFRDLRHEMPLQYVWTFLLVATAEGKGVKEYADLAGVPNSVMSRHLLDIGDRTRHTKGEGFGLVTSRPHPEELRKSEVFLTPKGKALAHRILRALEP